MPSERQDDFKSAAQGPVHQKQIDRLEALRPTLKPAPTLTPTGADISDVQRETFEKINRMIDHQQSFIRRRLARQKGRASGHFNKATDRRRGNDLGR